MVHCRTFQVLVGSLPHNLVLILGSQIPQACDTIPIASLPFIYLAFTSLLRHSLPCHEHRGAHPALLSAPLFWLATILDSIVSHQRGIWLESYHHTPEKHLLTWLRIACCQCRCQCTALLDTIRYRERFGVLSIVLDPHKHAIIKCSTTINDLMIYQKDSKVFILFQWNKHHIREESFITRCVCVGGGGGCGYIFMWWAKHLTTPPIPLEKNSRPHPQISDKNVCDPPPPPQPSPKHHCFFLAALNEGSYILLGTTYLNCILIYYQLQNYIAFQLLNELTTKPQRIIGPVSLTWVLRTC